MSKQMDWRQIAWHVGVRGRKGKIWTLTSNEWFFKRKDCVKYIQEEINVHNGELYEYKPIKCVMVRP